jgi:outer membrane protein TolC
MRCHGRAAHGARMSRRSALYAVALLLVHAWAVAPADAQARHESASAPTAIDFAGALRLAAQAPDLRAAAAAEPTWRARVGAPHRPTLRATAGPGWADAEAVVEVDVTASWTPRRADASRAAARAAIAATAAATSVERRERRAVAAERWLAVWSAQARQAIHGEELARARRLVELAERGRVQGVATRVDQATAVAYQLEVEAEALTLEGDVVDAGYALAAALGDAPPQPRAARGPLPQLEVDGAPVSARAAAERAEAEAAHLAATAARRASGRQLEVGARVELGPATRAGLLVVGITWPGGDRGAIDAAAAEARAALLERRAEVSARAEAVAQARRQHEVEHARAVVAVEDRRVAALAEQVAALDAALRAGEVVMADVIVAERGLARARAAAIAARVAAAAAEVERALGAGWEGP